MKGVYITIVVLILVIAGAYLMLQKEGPNMPEPENLTANSTETIETKENTTTENKAPLEASLESANEGTSSQSAVNNNLKEFKVSGDDFSFDVKKIEVSKGDKVKIVFTNTKGKHDLRVEGYSVGTSVLASGASETFEFTADKVGTFEYFCSVGSHREFGMKGSLVVK